MIVGVPKETVGGERRVALLPDSIPRLKALSFLVERGAGEEAGAPDSQYAALGAGIAEDAPSVFGGCDVVVKVQPPTTSEVAALREGGTLVSFLYPMGRLDVVRRLAAKGANSFALDLLPRISRAQSMDALSSQSLVAGYKAIMLAADSYPKLFPMLMTAAGTIAPAHVFVLGAGVAGLEAIATAHRLGAVVEAYDVRPAVKEQIESLGAKFVELPLDSKDSQTSGGYAKAQSEEFYRRQRDLLAAHAAQADVVITTALVPGSRAPLLITEDAVKGMKPGSVIVDLAAEQGGNCALTEPGKTVSKYGVSIQGPLNLPSSMAPQASQLFSRNLTSFLGTIVESGALKIDTQDEVVRSTLVVHQGRVVNESVRSALEKETK